MVVSLALWRRNHAQGDRCIVDGKQVAILIAIIIIIIIIIIIHAIIDYITSTIALRDTSNQFINSISTSAGPCEPERVDPAFQLRLSPTPVQAPVALLEELNLRFQPPYCLALTATIDNGLLINFFGFRDQTNSLGSLSILANELTYTISNESASFQIPGSAGAFATVQICIIGTEAIFFVNCEERGRMDFVNPPVDNVFGLSFLQFGSENGMNRYGVSYS